MRVTLGIVLAGLVVVAGVVGLTIVSGPDGYFTHRSVHEVQQYLDAAPVPDGAVLVVEETNPGHADVTTSVTREYRVTGTTPTCVQVLNAAKSAQWDFDYAGTPSMCAHATSGDLRPRGPSVATVTVTWDGPRLWYVLTEGDMPD
jgi:hypothetical protein